MTPVIVDTYAGGASLDELWIHDERDAFKASILVRLFEDPRLEGAMPRPFGVFFVNDRPTHEAKLTTQLAQARARKGPGDLDALLKGEHTWTIG